MGKVIINFNRNHPERQKDEVFCTNTDMEGFPDIGWKTKRPGDVAYDICGNEISRYPETFPVFVKILEIEKDGPDSERILEDLLPQAHL